MQLVYFLVGLVAIGIVIGLVWLFGNLGLHYGSSGALNWFENAIGFLIVLGASFLVMFFIYKLGESIVNNVI